MCNKKRLMALSLVFAMTIQGVCGIGDSFAAKKIALKKTKLTLKVGKKATIKVKGTKKKAKFKSGNKKIATVTKKGVVKAKKVGKTTIVVKVAKKTLKCKVIVIANAKSKDNGSENKSDEAKSTSGATNTSVQGSGTPGGSNQPSQGSMAPEGSNLPSQGSVAPQGTASF